VHYRVSSIIQRFPWHCQGKRSFNFRCYLIFTYMTLHWRSSGAKRRYSVLAADLPPPSVPRGNLAAFMRVFVRSSRNTCQCRHPATRSARRSDPCPALRANSTLKMCHANMQAYLRHTALALETLGVLGILEVRALVTPVAPSVPSTPSAPSASH
jgi:hypothetical protein